MRYASHGDGGGSRGDGAYHFATGKTHPSRGDGAFVNNLSSSGDIATQSSSINAAMYASSMSVPANSAKAGS